MAQEVKTSLMTGGLDLITPPIAMPPGKAIAAINYESDYDGYTSSPGYERFDGRLRPSDETIASVIEDRRRGIHPPPGIGPTRGVYTFDGYVYAFRDQDDGFAGMFRSSAAGWERMPFGHIMEFGEGKSRFVEGDFVAGVETGSTAHIDRVITRSGNYDAVDPTATGYLIISNISGAFAVGGDEQEQLTSTSGGDAIGYPSKLIQIFAGGRYEFITHNFYGAAYRPRMYFVNGVDTAFEWDGEALAPIQTGITGGEALGVIGLAAPIQLATYPTERPVFTPEVLDPLDIIPPPTVIIPESPVVMSALFDSPAFIAQYKNHLFLGYTSGTALFSSLGVPTEFNTGTGAGEISFGQQLTGLQEAANTSLLFFAQNRAEYLTGDDNLSFVLNPLTASSGAQPYSIQPMDEPMFLDDAGVRKLSATSAFGDWRMGSVTGPVEALIRQKRDSGVMVSASLRVKAKDQYRLFWSDKTGITVFIGRKNPETMPFKLPIQVFCTCAGEVNYGEGDRIFVGAEDGYVYEMNRGTSHDGAPIQSYIRLPFTAAGSPSQDTRWMKATFELATPDPITLGVAFDVDYGRGLGGSQVDMPVDAGSPLVSTDLYPDITWLPVESRLEYHLSGIGPNIAATLIHNSAVARPHTISSQTYNFSRRRMKR